MLTIIMTFLYKTILICIVAFIVAIAGEFMAETGMGIIDWEAAWAESQSAMIVSGLVALVVIALAIMKIKKRNEA